MAKYVITVHEVLNKYDMNIDTIIEAEAVKIYEQTVPDLKVQALIGFINDLVSKPIPGITEDKLRELLGES